MSLKWNHQLCKPERKGLHIYTYATNHAAGKLYFYIAYIEKISWWQVPFWRIGLELDRMLGE